MRIWIWLFAAFLVLAGCVASTSAGKTPEVLDPSGPLSEPEFANCDQVIGAGLAPLRRGQPGYSATLDRDGDGVACEV